MYAFAEIFSGEQNGLEYNLQSYFLNYNTYFVLITCSFFSGLDILRCLILFFVLMFLADEQAVEF
jgi:hypothetical protein